MVLSQELRAKKLQKLAEIEGLSVEQMARNGVGDSVCAAICIRDDCDYATEMEGDQERGYCEGCGHNTVVSCLIILGII